MELKSVVAVRQHSDVHFFTLTLVVWMILSFCIEGGLQHLTAVQWVFFSAIGILPFVLFKAFENIDALPAVNRQRDVFSMTVVFLLGTIASDLLLREFLHGSTYWLSASSMFKSIPLAAIAMFGYGLFTVLLLRYDRKTKIVLDCAPAQLARIKRDFAGLNLAHTVEYLTRTDLDQHSERDAFNQIDLIIVSHDAIKQFGSDAVLLKAHLAGTPIIDAQEVAAKIAGHITLSETDLSRFLFGATQKTFFCRVLLRTKYFLEPFAAVLLGLILIPILGLTAILIKCMSKGPVLYVQNRTGHLGRQFKLVKFRSMCLDAERDGPQWCSPQDARVTGIGSFLRRTRIDELPQLWNVWKGEMSFIGPRPERPEIYKKLESEVPLFSLRTLVPPGITGWAQVSAGYAASSAESLRKLEYDLSYIQHMSLRFDFYILMKTLKIACLGDKNARKSMSEILPGAVQEIG